jgi:hypothetical protein
MTAPAATPTGDCCEHDPEEGTAAGLRGLSLAVLGGVVLLPLLPAVGPLCPLRRVTGVPCPLCGSTTAMMALARGEVGAAFAANPMAPILVLLMALAWIVLLTGRRRLPVRTRTLGRSIAAVLPGLWLFQLHRYDLI